MKLGITWRTGMLAAAVPVLAVGITLGSAVYSQQDQGLSAIKQSADMSKIEVDSPVWKAVPTQKITLMAQPIALPRPKLTLTEAVQVQVAHDGKWVAFHLNWKDTEMSEGGRLAKFSDAVALEFPVKVEKDQPPSIFMGEVGKPVHIYHWRAQYQKDMAIGRHPTMKDLYPNMSIDAYPLEFPDPASPQGTEAQQRAFSPGRQVGNPQSYKKHGVDEIFAEGYGSSSVANSIEASSASQWANGEWHVVIRRPLKSTQGSELLVGQKNYMGVAAWQGGKNEVGSRKSVTLAWINLELKP